MTRHLLVVLLFAVVPSAFGVAVNTTTCHQLSMCYQEQMEHVEQCATLGAKYMATYG